MPRPRGDAFEDLAGVWDSRPLMEELVDAAAKALIDGGIVGPSDSCLDVGSGTGLLCEAIADSVLDVIGVDNSSSMVDEFRYKLFEPGFPRNVSCVLGDISKEQYLLGEARFDRIISHMTFHHLPHIPEMLAAIVEHLKPGGILAVSDLLFSEHSHRYHNAAGVHTVCHRGGFSLEEMEKYFKKAGLVDVQVRALHDFEKPAEDNPAEVVSFQLFMATGKKSFMEVESGVE